MRLRFDDTQELGPKHSPAARSVARTRGNDGPSLLRKRRLGLVFCHRADVPFNPPLRSLFYSVDREKFSASWRNRPFIELSINGFYEVHCWLPGQQYKTKVWGTFEDVRSAAICAILPDPTAPSPFSAFIRW